MKWDAPMQSLYNSKLLFFLQAKFKSLESAYGASLSHSCYTLQTTERKTNKDFYKHGNRAGSQTYTYFKGS